MEVREKRLIHHGFPSEGQSKRQRYSESDKNSSRRDPECPEDEQNEKVNQDTASSNKPRDKWEEGLNKERNSNERIQREMDKFWCTKIYFWMKVKKTITHRQPPT